MDNKILSRSDLANEPDLFLCIQVNKKILFGQTE